MSTTELSDMLFKQEYMKNTAQEQSMTEAQIIQQRIESLTIQEKLQKAIEKISETFANFAAGPVGDFLLSMKGILSIIGAIGGAALGNWISKNTMLIAQSRILASLTRQEAGNSIVGAAADTASSAAKVPGIGWMMALPAALALAGGLLPLLLADDLFSPRVVS